MTSLKYESAGRHALQLRCNIFEVQAAVRACELSISEEYTTRAGKPHLQARHILIVRLRRF